jgi:hypothetical protein
MRIATQRVAERLRRRPSREQRNPLRRAADARRGRGQAQRPGRTRQEHARAARVRAAQAETLKLPPRRLPVGLDPDDLEVIVAGLVGTGGGGLTPLIFASP